MMRFSLCLLLCCALCVSAQFQVPTLLWASESVFGVKTETAVTYETLLFVDLWNSVLQAFVSGGQENKANALFTPTNNEPEVFVVFVSGQEMPWQMSGDTSVSQPLRSAFTQSPARFSFNNVYLESGKLMDFVPDSLEAAGADVTYLGSCVNADSSSLESGLKARLAEKTNGQKVIVVCGGGALQDEMKQVETVNKAVKAAKVGYVMMFVSEFGSTSHSAEYLNPQRRKLAQGDEFESESESRLPIRYDFCDNLCVTRVKFLEGIILALILALAMTAGLCCMNILDTPTQFEKSDDAET